MSVPWTESADELDLLDLVEQLVRAQGWAYERGGEEELHADVPGQWATYRVWFGWHEDLGLFQIACTLDLEVPEGRLPAVAELLCRANPRLWLGHFELWPDSRLPAFRHGVLFREGSGISPETVADLVDIVVHECDRFYPAFRAVVEQGRDPEDALTAAMLETEGEA